MNTPPGDRIEIRFPELAILAKRQRRKLESRALLGFLDAFLGQSRELPEAQSKKDDGRNQADDRQCYSSHRTARPTFHGDKIVLEAGERQGDANRRPDGRRVRGPR
jgi:hypothetical protein